VEKSCKLRGTLLNPAGFEPQSTKLAGPFLDRDYSQISDEELDTLVKEFKRQRPTTGLSYLRGHILQLGWRVQRERLLASISRVDSVRKVLRKNSTIQRRQYVSSRPNAVWHIDGHHKLGPYGFIIHALIDGCDDAVGFFPLPL